MAKDKPKHDPHHWPDSEFLGAYEDDEGWHDLYYAPKTNGDKGSFAARYGDQEHEYQSMPEDTVRDCLVGPNPLTAAFNLKYPLLDYEEALREAVRVVAYVCDRQGDGTLGPSQMAMMLMQNVVYKHRNLLTGAGKELIETLDAKRRGDPSYDDYK